MHGDLLNLVQGETEKVYTDEEIISDYLSDINGHFNLYIS